MIERSQKWRNISARIEAAFISARIISTKKKNQALIKSANKKDTSLCHAFILEREKNNEHFKRNVERARACEHGNTSDSASDWNYDATSDWDCDGTGCDARSVCSPLLVRGLELLKKKSGNDGYHGSIDHLVGLGKSNQGGIVLLATHSMKHFSLAPPDNVEDVFDLSALFYPEDVEAPSVSLVYKITIARPVLFVK